MKSAILYLVIPCYNEQEVLPITAPEFKNQLLSLIEKGKISKKSKILFVNDGSKDNTWEIISRLSKEDNIFKGISLSRNKGHQNALIAGLEESVKYGSDITVSIDCDGQDDITVIENMVDEYINGADIVYGVRKDRKSDTLLKRTTALGFYKFLKLMGVETVYNHADYRLLSKRVLEAFSDYKEVNLYLRGMFQLVGFKSTAVYYTRTTRLAGKTHYPFKKMISLAIDGITSFSVKPIRIITALGFFVALLSFVGIAWSVIAHFLNKTVSGWSSIVSIICFVSGVQLLSLGVVGEYIGKIYMEVKARPRYIISERTDDIK